VKRDPWSHPVRTLGHSVKSWVQGQTAPLSPEPHQELVLVGGGHSHAIVLKLWGMNPLPGVRLTLITDQTHTPYSGMLPGHVAGFYDFDSCHIDLRQLAQFAGAQFYLDRAIGLDLNQNRVLCQTHPPVAFQWLSLDIGSTPTVDGVPGAAEYALAAKPVPEFLQGWNALLAEVEADPQRRRQWAVVGGGAGGVELLLALRSRLQNFYRHGSTLEPSPNALRPTWEPSAPPKVQGDRLLPVTFPVTLPVTFHLIHRGNAPLTGHNLRVQRQFQSLLNRLGVVTHWGETVTAVVPDPDDSQRSTGQRYTGQRYQLQQRSGRSLVCDRLFWVTQASAPPWLQQSGLATDDRGFVRVGPSLQSLSHPQVLATGDIASLEGQPRPKAGVFAVRQGKPLFENLQRLCQGQPLRPFIPQRQILALIGDGQGRALASRGIWSLGFAPWLWYWKNRIDLQFMAQFTDLPPGMMAAPPPPRRSPWTANPAPLPPPCAGCGSKVGAQSLDRVLHRLRDLRPATSPDTLVGLDCPDDAAVLQIPPGKVLVQTVDFFPALVSDPFVFGQITANHCLNDLLAMGATPHSALALVTLNPGSPALQEETLYQVLAGALRVLAPLGVDLVGGHTTTGQGLAFGLSCNGWGDRNALWSKGGLKPGQVLILTKPLGTGTLMAGAMQGRVKGYWVDGAIAAMVQSNAPALDIFRHHGTTACTDITGFGLLGHVVEMVRASGVSVRLESSAIPRLPGAKDTWNRGIFSSLHPQNAQALQWLDPRSIAPSLPLQGLLCDPQTAGGLLAAVPLDQAQSCLRHLRQGGYGASALVGMVQLMPDDRPGVLLV